MNYLFTEFEEVDRQFDDSDEEFEILWVVACQYKIMKMHHKWNYVVLNYVR